MTNHEIEKNAEIEFDAREAARAYLTDRISAHAEVLGVEMLDYDRLACFADFRAGYLAGHAFRDAEIAEPRVDLGSNRSLSLNVVLTAARQQADRLSKYKGKKGEVYAKLVKQSAVTIYNAIREIETVHSKES